MNKIEEILEGLLLPIPHLSTSLASKVVVEVLKENGINEEDHAQTLINLIDKWRQDNIIDAKLMAIINKGLLVCNDELSFKKTIAQRYLEIHQDLKRTAFVDHSLATIVLSHLRLICYLRNDEKMSGSKILQILTSIDSRLSIIRWQDINNILNKLSLKALLDKDLVDKQYELDVLNSAELFADASDIDACEIMDIAAQELKYPNDLYNTLLEIIDSKKLHLPYLQILHFQCCIIDFYDHRLASAYEFTPRGVIASSVFKRWDQVVSTGNPILNNMKAVDEVNESWANSRRKDKEYESAKNLVQVFSSMDTMGFAATKELAKWIRAFLVRYIEVNSLEIAPISITTTEEIEIILSKIYEKPTETYGVLEQRFVDYCTLVLFKDSQFRVRGNGDAVNSNNWAKKKLGDIDFQSSEELRIITYEPHGGNLTEAYLEGHIRSLKRTILRRKEELDTISDPANWDISIVFVAYSFGITVKREVIFEGYSIKLFSMTFEELYNSLDADQIDLFNNHFLTQINDRRTPEKVRIQIRDYMKE